MRVVNNCSIAFVALAILVGHYPAASAQSPPAADEAAVPAPWDPAGIEDFSLTERSGRTITKADLLGKPWLACFVFTRCAGPCPRVSSQMKLLQDKLQGTDVQLVTFDVDPENDTPDVLTNYAQGLGADANRWWFLTGDKRTIYHLIHHSFKMPVQETLGADRKPGFEIIHSTNIMYVDAKGRVMGKYNAGDDADMVRLRRVLMGKKVPARSDEVEPGSGANENAQPADDGQAKRPAAALEGDDAGQPRLEIRIENTPDWILRLPAVNASLNGLATILLLLGYGLIKSGRPRAHQVTMLSAFATSIVFLGCYLVYHYFAGSKKFAGTGVVSTFYYAILLSHVILAMAVPILASITIFRALTKQWERHKQIARITFPIWLYVSVTGVIIYAMLYHWPKA